MPADIYYPGSSLRQYLAQGGAGGIHLLKADNHNPTIWCDPSWSLGDMFGLLANILAYVSWF